MGPRTNVIRRQNIVACDCMYMWLAQDSSATGRAWNSLDTIEQTPLWYFITLTTLIYTDRATPLQWLQMPWRQIGGRPSAITMLI